MDTVFLKGQLKDIYNEYVDKIYRFIFWKVNSREIAQDLTAETFTKVFEYLSKDNGTEKEIKNIGAFIYSSARNTVTDYYRQKSKGFILLDDSNIALTNHESPVARTADYNALQADSSREVRLALSNLRDDYREILTLHYIEDMSAKEISNILGKPEGTVRVMVHRGLKELRRRMIS